jgi:hypothetical protein
MKRSYYIAPVLILGLFSFFYWQHMGDMKLKEQRQQAERARIQAEEDAKKRDAQRKAEEDARKRMADREAEERKKEADKLAKQQKERDAIKADTDRYNAQIAEFNKKSATLDKDLVALRAERERLIRETFSTAKKIEIAMVERRNAELQVQRMAEMVANRANQSAMAKLPSASPTAAK